MGNQFGFKPTLGTDMCIYSLKEIIGSYSQLNGCVFSCFLDASKAFDRVKHSMLFTKLLRRLNNLVNNIECLTLSKALEASKKHEKTHPFS